MCPKAAMSLGGLGQSIFPACLPPAPRQLSLHLLGGNQQLLGMWKCPPAWLLCTERLLLLLLRFQNELYSLKLQIQRPILFFFFISTQNHCSIYKSSKF